MVTGSQCDYSAPNNRVSRQLRSDSLFVSENDQGALGGAEEDTEIANGEVTDHDIIAICDLREVNQPSACASSIAPAMGVYNDTAIPNFGSTPNHSIDHENQCPPGVDRELHPLDVLMDMDSFGANTVPWSLLHENLFMSDAPITYSGNFDYPGLDFNAQSLLGDSAAYLPPQEAVFNLGERNATIYPAVEDQHTSTASLLTGLEQTRSLLASGSVSDVTQASRTESNTVNLQASGTSFQPQAMRQSDNAPMDQIQVVNEIVAYASNYSTSSMNQPRPALYWKAMSVRVNTVFKLGSRSEGPDQSRLQAFVDLYFEHFGPLWPLISLHNLEPDNLHPLLYLVLTSIGAMYGGPAANDYGIIMHSSVRVPLTMAAELEDGEDNPVWLAQARLLTQVAALYFGQSKAISYSQHLGALLVAQARRMDLFSSTPAQHAMKIFRSPTDSVSDVNRLDIWLQLEARRRLAFGIFRGAIYLSVLLHTKPLVLLEEIDLEFPSCNAVWRSRSMEPRVCLQIIDHERPPSSDMRASDIYRIAMDRLEPLPPLDPASQELLIFALQWPLWQFSRDRQMSNRLTGQPIQVFEALATVDARRPSHLASNAADLAASYTEIESLDLSSRKMLDLQVDSSRLAIALQKWERALPLVKTFVQTDVDRSSLLSSLILYHLGFVRMNAPIEDLHQIQYRLADNRPLNEDLVETVGRWANTASATVAAESACTIWSLISREAGIATKRRVKFNLVAFTALHHGAVLLWAFAGARRRMDEASSPRLILKPTGETPIMISKTDCPRMLASFIRLYDLVSPARWSSFARAVEVLRKQEFPSTW